jgi:hypothetical protein
MLTERQIASRIIEIRRRWNTDDLHQQRYAARLELKQTRYWLLRSPTLYPGCRNIIITTAPKSELSLTEKHLTKKIAGIERKITESRRKSISLLMKFKNEMPALIDATKKQTTEAELLKPQALRHQLLDLLATIYREGNHQEQSSIKDTLLTVRDYIIDFIVEKTPLIKKHPTLTKTYGEFATYVIFKYLIALNIDQYRSDTTEPLPQKTEQNVLTQLKKAHPYVRFHSERHKAGKSDIRQLGVFGEKEILIKDNQQSKKITKTSLKI